MTWELALIGASLWLAAGMTIASALYRRGHDGWHWMLICGIAGPLAVLVLANQARVVEPSIEALHISAAAPRRDGITAIVPADAVGAIDAAALERLGLPIGRVAVTSTVAFETARSVVWHELQTATDAILAEARQRFAPYPVELIVLPGSTADSMVTWAAEQAPAAIVTTNRTHHPRTLARIVRLAAERRGLSILVLDPVAIATSARQAA